MVAIFSPCLNLKDKQDARGAAHAGSEKCIKCHQNNYASYLQTAHDQSSRPAAIHSAAGNFAEGHNRVTFNGGKKDSGPYQVSYAKEKRQGAIDTG
jgi:hypothetical protein